MKHLTLTFAVVAMLCCNNFVSGQLYDSPPTGSINCIVNQDFPDFPDFSAFAVDDVTFGKDVTLGSVTCYFTFDSNLDGVTWPIDNAGTPFTAVLNIFEDDGALDGNEDPLSGMVVDVQVEDGDANGDGFIAVTACGLNIDLTAGTYWIGLTPTIEFGLYGQEFHCNSDSANGDEGHLINPGGAFGLPAGSGWGGVSLQFGGAPFDLSMTIYDQDQSPDCPDDGCMIGDVNMDGVVDLLDVAPFVNKITQGLFCCEADVNEDGVVDLLDVAPFVALLTGG